MTRAIATPEKPSAERTLFFVGAGIKSVAIALTLSCADDRWAFLERSSNTRNQDRSTVHNEHSTSRGEGSWSKPRPVVGGGAVLRFPQIVSGPRSNTFVGYQITNFDSSPVDSRSLKFLTDSGESFDGPGGDWVFAWAHAALAPDGTLHLLWAEPRVRAPRYEAFKWPPADLAVIWQSARSADGTWSAPRAVVDGDRVYFAARHRGGSPSFMGRPAVLSFVVYARSASAGVQSLVLENEGWRLHPAFRGDGRSVQGRQSAAAYGNDGLFVALAGEVPRGDGSPIIEYREVNELTGSWGRAEIAFVGSPKSSIQSMSAPAGPDGIPRIAFLQEMDEQFQLTLLTRRGVGRWDSTSIRVPFAVSELHTAIDRDSRIHFVLENRAWSFESSHLYHVVHHETWSTLQEVAPGIQGTAPALAIGRDGRPILLFTQIKAKIQSLVSEWDPSSP